MPYGATHLRMAELPWAAPPPCGNQIAYNASGASVLHGRTPDDFDTCGIPRARDAWRERKMLTAWAPASAWAAASAFSLRRA